MDYFVDSMSGNDGNSGTSEAEPWRTLAKASDFFSQKHVWAGDRLLLRAGRGWKEELNFNGQQVSGLPDRPFVITSYGEGSLPSISGADRATGWIEYTENIWYFDGLSEVQDVYYQNNRVLKVASLSNLSAGRSFYDEGAKTLYVWLPDSSSPNQVKVEISSRNYGLRVRTAQAHLVIENLYVHHHRHDCISVYSNSNLECSDVTIQRCHTAFGGVDATYSVDSADGIVVYGQSDGNRMRNLRVIGNYSHHNLNCAVECGKVDGALIAGNRFEYCSNGLELWRASSNVNYERNAVSHMNNTNQLNRKYKEAGAWIHEYLGEETTDNQFTDNVFINCVKGIQIWQGDVVIERNSFVDCRWMAVDFKHKTPASAELNNNMLTVSRTQNQTPGVFVHVTAEVDYRGDNNVFLAPNPKKKNVIFTYDGSNLDFEDWKSMTGQDQKSFKAAAVLADEAPPASDVATSGGWWVSK